MLHINTIDKWFKRFRGITQDNADNDPYFQAIRPPKHFGGVNYKPDSFERIIAGLQQFGYEVQSYKLDVDAYQAYFKEADYLSQYPTYYDFLLPEKSLEHYIAAQFLQLQPDDVYIDIANEGSPTPEIYHRLFGCKTYRQDIRFPPGINNDMIGGDAGNMDVLPDGFASKMALHCSFEHFEGDSDINFIQEAGRILRPGGAVCIVPLYLFDKYAIQTAPSISVPQKVQFEEDAIICCDENWKNRHGRFYDPAHLFERVHKHLKGLTMTIYKITNAKEVDPNCYVEFTALITKS